MSDAHTSKLSSSGAATGRLALVVSSESSVTTKGLPDTGTLTIGRIDSCGLQIEDDSVSRTHALIRCGPQPTIEDAGSTNGTRVLGRILEKGERVEIDVGSVIQIGRILVLVQHAGSAGASIAAGAGTRHRPPGVVFEDETMKQLYGLLDVVAPTQIPVLILGETGVGKEVFAEALHQRSARAGKPFLKLNCAALAESILESELFGHEKGSFTGAVQTKIGLFESAHGGTVFLDELGELPLTTQAKLLRVLENGEVTRLGSVRPQKIDFRLVSATNRDLQARIEEGQFRGDLFFRVNGFSLTLPPLRERKDDIVALGRHFLNGARARLGKPPLDFSAGAIDAMLTYGWKGNIRELRNLVERAALLASGNAIEVEDLTLAPARGEMRSLPPLVRPAPSAYPPPPRSSTDPDVTMPSSVSELKERFSELERAKILEALHECAGNQSLAAKKLGMRRSTLVRRLEEYGVPRPRKGQ